LRWYAAVDWKGGDAAGWSGESAFVSIRLPVYATRSNLMRQTRLLFATLLALLSLILAACGGGGNNAAAPAETAAPAAPAATSATAAAEAPAATAAATTDAAPAATETATTTDAEPAATATAATTDGPPSAVAPIPTDLRTDLSGATITLVTANSESGFQINQRLAQRFTEATGINVNLIRGPESATERLAQYQQQLGAGATDVDIYEIDVIWPGILAQHAEDVSDVLASQGADHFPAIVENNTVDGKLVGVPAFTDAGLLYYRTDLLEKYGFANPPATWAELEEQARTIQEGERTANPDFFGFVWQGNAYEGLTCNALEWQVSNGGGSIIEPDGTVTVNNPQTIAALERARSWVGTISPPDSTTYMEEQARALWQAGNAAFMRNWPYAYSLGQAEDSVIRDNFAVTVLPQGDGPNARNAATLGGWQLMVSTYSQNKDAAKEFVKYMTSPEVQVINAVERSLLPTIASVYEDQNVLAANPYFAQLLPVFSGGAVARPSTVSADLYNDVSIAYFTAVSQVLNGQQEAAPAMEALQAELEDVLE
jgi:trehalose/maltose transport system substrate-binding protein